MAGKKDYAVVSVISGLTRKQAANITSDIINTKNKHAPLSRGTAASGLTNNVGKMLKNGVRKVIDR